MLVVVHPDLENVALDANVHTELLDCEVVVLLNPPTQLFCEGAHLILLLLRELGPEPFFHSMASHVHGMSTGTAHHVIVVLTAHVADRHDHLRMGTSDTGWTGGQRQGHMGSRHREVKPAGPLGGAVAVASVAAVIAGSRGVTASVVGVSPVEITVAATGSALQGLQSAFVAARHELPAAIVCVAPDAGRMVLQAFSILDAAWLCERHPRRRRCLV